MNSRGETLDLLNQNGAMFFEPEGLGYEEEADWLRLGTTFRPVNITPAHRTISGKMYFLGEEKAYENYYKFVRFIRQNPLTIEYTAYDTFKIDVRVQSIDKSELTTYGTLECKINFLALGPFYKFDTYYIAPPKRYGLPIVNQDKSNIVDHVDDLVVTGGPQGTTYDYVYDHVYPEEEFRTAVFDVDFADYAPLRVSIYGPCTNPQWMHYADENFVASGKYNGFIAEDRILVIDSTSVPYKIYETDLNGDFQGDRYGGCDFSTERFLFAQNGRNRVTIAHDDPDEVGYKVEVKQCYESV
jgi:hypothetical protein